MIFTAVSSFYIFAQFTNDNRTQAIFSMQVDLFSQHLPWQFYIYTALVLMFIVFSGHALLRFRGRVVRLLEAIMGSLAHWLFEGFTKFYQDLRKGSAAPGKTLPILRDNSIPHSATIPPSSNGQQVPVVPTSCATYCRHLARRQSSRQA